MWLFFTSQIKYKYCQDLFSFFLRTPFLPYRYSISADSTGLKLKFQGFNHKLRVNAILYLILVLTHLISSLSCFMNAWYITFQNTFLSFLKYNEDINRDPTAAGMPFFWISYFFYHSSVNIQFITLFSKSIFRL